MPVFEKPLLLRDLLGLPFQAGHLSLTVSTAADGGGEVSSCRLQVRPAGNDDLRHELPRCSCSHGTILVPGRSSGESSPLGIVADAESLWLAPEADGSSIVLRESATSGMIFVVPFYCADDAWARVERGTAEQPGR